MASSRIQVNVGGTYTHYAPAERCVATIRVCKEGDSQASVVESVTATSNELTEFLKALCPRDRAETAENIQPHVPVTYWSMSSLATSSWIPYVPANGTNEVKPAPRQFRATTVFSIKFIDFKKMGEICLNIAKNDDISIQNLDWQLTHVTNQRLKLVVRQGAVKEAVVKALDYCSVFSPSTDTTWEIDAKEISDEGGNGGIGYGAPKAMMMRSMGGGPGGGSGESQLNFQPEDVAITSTVQCKFECCIESS